MKNLKPGMLLRTKWMIFAYGEPDFYHIDIDRDNIVLFLRYKEIEPRYIIRCLYGTKKITIPFSNNGQFFDFMEIVEL